MIGNRFLWLALAICPLVGAAPQDGEAKKPPAPLKTPPRIYFRDHCQRCHGVDGSNLIPGFADRETPEKLRADVKRMADGPGEAPLGEKDLEVQTVYMQLVSAGKPFLAWTALKGTTLSGEASDGATVTATLGDQPIKVVVDDDYQWTLVLPSIDDLAKLKVTATLEKQSTVLTPAEKPYGTLPKPKKSGEGAT